MSRVLSRTGSDSSRNDDKSNRTTSTHDKTQVCKLGFPNRNVFPVGNGLEGQRRAERQVSPVPCSFHWTTQKLAGTRMGLQITADIPFCEFILIISEFCLVIQAENPNQNERDVSFM